MSTLGTASRTARTQEVRRDPQRGAAAVEFALVFPLFLALLMGTIDYGYYFFSDQIVTNAAREGARAGTLVTPGVGASALAVSAAGAAAASYLTSNGLGCPGGGSGCITATSTTVSDLAGINSPALDVVIDYASVSLTGFTGYILPAKVHAHAVMRWQ
jgi:Flp pilus assembly protein TadG